MSAGFMAGVLVAAALQGPAAPAQTPPAPPPGSGWRDGFVLQSDTGDYRLQFNAGTWTLTRQEHANGCLRLLLTRR